MHHMVILIILEDIVIRLFILMIPTEAIYIILNPLMYLTCLLVVMFQKHFANMRLVLLLVVQLISVLEKIIFLTLTILFLFLTLMLVITILREQYQVMTNLVEKFLLAKLAIFLEHSQQLVFTK